MNAGLSMLAACFLGAPWGQPTYVTYSCDPCATYVPCGTVYMPQTVFVSDCCGNAVVVESGTKAAESSVAANASAEETVANALAEGEGDPATEAVAATEEDKKVLKPAGLSIGPNLGLDHMALDWGSAQSGVGTLYPSPQYESMGRGLYIPGGMFSGNGSTGSGGGYYYPYSQGQNVNNITIINNNVNDNGNDGHSPVPEPISASIWFAGLGAVGSLMGLRRAREKDREAVDAHPTT